ncbi:PLP-dependent transferase [Daejeonella sp.]|uniref:PLP-dependent transferase n=1 Tax=Daejeonella sp. TaxID=2805397 RepID=UPI0027305BB0|nr:PLP-dependent transferase [Daejeonella sp.]MDP2415118.1 PLP-dependent transferase [Daejeonella sp.]
MKRREIIKGLTLLPFAGSAVAAPMNESSFNINGIQDHLEEVSRVIDEELVKKGESLLKSIGVEPFVNCKGTNTIMGGSIERKEVRLAMESVSTLNVQMDELAFGIGKRLAELTGAEWGIVTAGCAAGIKMVTAACLTGGDPEKLLRIPDLTGFAKSEVIIPLSCRNVYDHAVRNAGVKVITVESLDELKRSINSRTAMIYMTPSEDEFTISSVSKIAKPLNIPVFVDAAAHILTIPDVHLAQGADVVGYSGGKGIKAPSCSGLILGRKDLLMSAHQVNSPHHGFGRDNKVGREEHIGMLAAVEAWVKLDHLKEMNTWVSWLETINKKVSTINGIKTTITRPDPELIHHVTPYLHIRWNPEQLHVTGEDVAEELGTIAPRIAVQVGKDEAGLTGITLVGYMMIEGNDKVAANRIHEVLSRKRQPKVIPAMKNPVMNMVGQWDMEVEYYSSKVTQHLFIDNQDGNWITGIFKSDFSSRPFSGSIDGNEVKILCNYNVPGDRILTTMQGSINSGVLAGEMDFDEFNTAKFTAKKHKYSQNKKPINYPKHRPQSS